MISNKFFVNKSMTKWKLIEHYDQNPFLEKKKFGKILIAWPIVEYLIDLRTFLSNFSCYTVQQIEKSWKHLSSDYVGLIGFDERWKVVHFSWAWQVRFSSHPNFWFFDFGRLPNPNPMCYQRNFFTKISEI
jgi:hypothetical protein